MARRVIFDPWLVLITALLVGGGWFMVGCASNYVALEFGKSPQTGTGITEIIHIRAVHESGNTELRHSFLKECIYLFFTPIAAILRIFDKFRPAERICFNYFQTATDHIGKLEKVFEFPCRLKDALRK